jgi:hypothetical protein
MKCNETICKWCKNKHGASKIIDTLETYQWAFERRACGAWWVAATILLQGQHFDHGAKVTTFAVIGAYVTERVKHIGYLLREGLGDVEVVAADVEEGAAIIEAVLEVGQVVADAVEGPNLQTRLEATFSPRADEGPGRNLTPLAAVLCPMVGTNCHGNLETVAMGWPNEGLDDGDDGSGSGLCQQRHLGLPKFRALPDGGKTTTSCLLWINSTVVTILLELFGLEEEQEDPISLV